MTKRTVTIRFTTDKTGKRRAYYWGLAHRWLPISIAEAELKLATGEAIRQPTTSDPLPANYVHTSVDGDILDDWKKMRWS
jgi:hypothetical protein